MRFLTKIKNKLYFYLVESNQTIKEKYQEYVNSNRDYHRKNRIKSWKYLIALNLRYRFRKSQKIEKQALQAKSSSPSNKKALPNAVNNNKKIRMPHIAGPESEALSRTQAHFYVKSLLKYDVISFDIFDTLILRPFSKPEHLFHLVGKKLGIQDFAATRKQAEKYVREMHAVKYGNREVTIYDIYNRISDILEIDADLGAQTEFEVELDMCFANPYMKRIYKMLVCRSKILIATSDMYYPEKMMRQLLEGCGYYFDEIIVSCDYFSSKHNLDLYKVIKSKYNTTNKIAHIGDNYQSDIVNAKKSGIDAYHYPNIHVNSEKFRALGFSELIGSAYSGIVNTFLHNGTKRALPIPFEYGFIYGGIYVLGFCNWLNLHIKREGIDKVLFLARDGDIYQKVFQKLETNVEFEYAYWSRISHLLCTTNMNKGYFLDVALKPLGNLGHTVSSILQSFQLEDMSPCFEKEKIKLDMIVTNNNIQQINEVFIKYWDNVSEIHKKTEKAAELYFRHLLKGVHKVALVDVGWRGNITLGLKYLIEEKWKLNCKVYSYLAASRSHGQSNINELLSNQIETYIFSPLHNKNLHDTHSNTNKNTNNIYFELFSQACAPSFRCFSTEKENDGLSLSFDIPEVENYYTIEQIHEGILVFCDLYINRFANYPYMLNISGYDAYMPFQLIIRSMNYFKKYFSKITYARNIGIYSRRQRVDTLKEIMDRTGI